MAQWEGGGWHARWKWVGLMDLGPGKAEDRVLGKKETFLGVRETLGTCNCKGKRKGAF